MLCKKRWKIMKQDIPEINAKMCNVLLKKKNCYSAFFFYTKFNFKFKIKSYI